MLTNANEKDILRKRDILIWQKDCGLFMVCRNGVEGGNRLYWNDGDNKNNVPISGKTQALDVATMIANAAGLEVRSMEENAATIKFELV